MPDHHGFQAGLREALLFLGAAGIAVPVVHRLRLSPVLGFLFVGMVLGPFGLGRLTGGLPWLSFVTLGDVHSVAAVGEFGVVFLLFTIGLELSFERLSAMRRLVFGLGPLQVGVSALVLGALAALAGGIAAPVAAVLGAALALSSTAIVVPVLAGRKRLKSGPGRAAFAVLLFQDLAVAPLLFGVGVLSRPASGSLGLDLAITLGTALAAIAAIVTLGRLVLRPLFHLVAATRSTEFFAAACLLVVVGTAAGAAAGGLSMALGAFVAGLLLAETEYRRQIEVTIEPFGGLLLGLFFVAVGAGLDPSRLLADPGRVLGTAAVLVGVKTLLLGGLALAVRLPRQVAAELALLLGPCGEFAFVIVGALVEGRLLDRTLGEDLLVSVTLSMVALPAIAVAAEALGRRLKARTTPAARPEPPPDDGEARVIIVGYGRVGQMMGEMLATHKVPFLAVDDDAALVRRGHAAGLPVVFGDATRPEFLRRCGLAQARALAVTVNAPAVAERVAAAGRAERADLVIVVRARDAQQAKALYDLGVTDAVPETIEASLHLAEVVLVDVGVPVGLVIASVHAKRDEIRAMLHVPGERRGERRAIRRRTPRTGGG